jgi:hypothetical protein
MPEAAVEHEGQTTVARFHPLPERLRPQNGPANMALIRHTALNTFKNVSSKVRPSENSKKIGSLG